MTRPLEPINLDDPVVSRQPQREGKVHPPPVPLTFSETFGAVFLAILAAAAVVGIVAWITISIQAEKKLRKEIEELHQRARP